MTHISYKAVGFCLVIFMSLTGCSNLGSFFDEKRTGEETQLDHIDVTPEDANSSNESANESEEGEWVLEQEYFNELEVQEDLAVILNPDNVLSLVNKDLTLPGNYEPDDLVKPNVTFSFGDAEVPKSYLRREAASALETMFHSAEQESIILYAVSGFRAFQTQESIFNSEVNRKGVEAANETVAIPGQSEHQTGLAMDVSSESNNFRLTEEFGMTTEGKWVKENAHKYGFIIRYPKGKENLTGYQYEPWHLRYVGEKVATLIYEHDLTLEEYFERVKKI